MKIFSKYFGPCVALLLCSLSSCAKVDRKIKPNFIIIFADDLGYGDVSSYGLGTLQTPNIDKIANNGIKNYTKYLTNLLKNRYFENRQSLSF